jgi:hypothetical protein
MVYRAQNISVLWRPAILRVKCPKKVLPLGDEGLLKVRTLKVNYKKLLHSKYPI